MNERDLLRERIQSFVQQRHREAQDVRRQIANYERRRDLAEKEAHDSRIAIITLNKLLDRIGQELKRADRELDHLR
jgi:hypothetical protein